MEITSEMLDRAAAALVKARRAAANRARPSVRDQPARLPTVAAPPKLARTKLFPGFVLRQARRYRSRSTAPWSA
jgi:hypothetical protein